MASMFNPDSNSAKGPPATANVGGGKSMDMLSGMAGQFAGMQQQPRTSDFSQKILDPMGGQGGYQPPATAPDLSQQMAYSSAFGSKPTVGSPQSSVSTNPRGGK